MQKFTARSSAYHGCFTCVCAILSGVRQSDVWNSWFLPSMRKSQSQGHSHNSESWSSTNTPTNFHSGFKPLRADKWSWAGNFDRKLCTRQQQSGSTTKKNFPRHWKCWKTSFFCVTQPSKTLWVVSQEAWNSWRVFGGLAENATWQ